MSFTDIVQNAAGISATVATLTLLVGMVTLIKTLFEYTNQNSMKRFEKFQEMRKRFKEDTRFQEICFLLEDDSKQLQEVHFKDKRDFLGFFEEIALMHNSSLLKTQVAHYMFGYYAIRCYESENFWRGVNRNSYYWAIFCKFARDMKAIEETILDGATPGQLEQFRF
jgi:hypothetical protein